MLRLRSLGELLPINIMWGQGVSGGPMSWTWISHIGGSGPTPGWSTKTLPPHSSEEKEEKKNEQIELKNKW